MDMDWAVRGPLACRFLEFLFRFLELDLFAISASFLLESGFIVAVFDLAFLLAFLLAVRERVNPGAAPPFDKGPSSAE